LTDIGVNLLLKAQADQALAAVKSAATEVKALGAATRSAATDADRAAAASRNQAAAAQQIRTSHTLAAGSVGNLTAQFNDIGQMLLAGQNPLTLAVQQGTQISQVLGPLGAGGAVRALGSAFMGMINPVSLITIGSIAAGAAMFQWLTRSVGDAQSLEDRLEALVARAKEFTEASEDAGRSLSDLSGDFGRLSPQVAAAFDLREALRFGAAVDALRNTARDLGREFEYSFNQLRTAAAVGDGRLAQLEQTMQMTYAQAIALKDALQDVDIAEGPAEAAIAAEHLNNLLINIFGNAESLPPSFREMADAAAEIVIQAASINQQLEDGNNILSAMIGMANGAEVAVAGIGAAAGGIIANLQAAAAAAWGLAAARTAAFQAEQVQSSLSYEQQGGMDGATRAARNDDARRASATLAGVVSRGPAGPTVVPRVGRGGGGGGGGGGGSSRPEPGSLAALQAEAAEALASLDLAVAGIAEKVRAGLLTSAEGADAVDDATRRAAEGIAELIPEIERVGPAGIEVAADLRVSMTGLVADLRVAGSELSESLSSSFEGAFSSFLSGAKSGQDAFGDFADFVKTKIADLLAQRFTSQFVMPLFDSILGAVGLGAAPAVAGVGTARLSSDVLKGPGLSLARGPSGARRGESEAGAKAAPLGGRPGGDVTVNVINNAQGATAKVTERTEGGRNVIDVMIEQVRNQIAGDIAQGRGPVPDALASTYALSRSPR
jgi:hypothetical protein